LWVGWPGTFFYKEDKKKEKHFEKQLSSKFNYHPVFQTQVDAENYYYGYCNSTIWPLFHYFTQYAVYEKSFCHAYRRVNQHFCDVVLKNAGANDTIWVHDYHLMLLPQLLREKLPKAKIGFFLHIPFPSFEIFRLLPQREEILRGVLGADVVGLQTQSYARHFLDSVRRILGYDINFGQINTGDRIIKTDAFPIGIDYDLYSQGTQDSKVQKEISRLKKKIGSRKVILSVDRLDYTKGIPQRLAAFSEFLERHPNWREKVILILVASPSRTKVESYRMMKKHVDELIGRINGRFGSLGWNPIWYLYRSLDTSELMALYAVADVGLLTPIRDGMNLIAKEFVATRADGEGMLVLSEMAGAAEELREALIINPNNEGEIVEALKKALMMPKPEKVGRNKEMQKELQHFDEELWADNFMKKLVETRKLQEEIGRRVLTSPVEKDLIKSYQKARKRLLLLDYDGTLVSFAKTPGQARPDDDLLKLLERLAQDSKNEVVVVSGRDKDFLDYWFGKLNVTLGAEHGVWIKEKEGRWRMLEKHSAGWKEKILTVMEACVERTPGSFVEEKSLSLIWHYRKTDSDLGQTRARELVKILEDNIVGKNLQVMEGSKIVEVKAADVDKGKVASHFLGKSKWGFILSLGDDITDEDMFGALPKEAYTVKVGLGQSKARFRLKSVKDVRQLLRGIE
jgi:trehalose 6-phosphate synthase/phosphatase